MDNKKIGLNQRFVMSEKIWVFVIFIMFLLSLLLLAGFNYKLDPYQYFNEKSEGAWMYSQYPKSRHVLNNLEKYECFILGGSCSGTIDPELVESYTGYETFSYSYPFGNWWNYYEYTKFLVENTKVKCIILHLSSTELIQNKEPTITQETRKVPAFINGDMIDILSEKCSFLLKSIDLDREVDKQSICENGKVDWSYYVEQYEENPVDYVNQHVIHNYDSVAYLSNTSLDSAKVTEAIECMTAIQSMCAQNDVKLIVVNGPVFLTKRLWFEGNAYYDYLERLVDITDIYDFTSFNEINANPYNFYDVEHYNYDVANEVVKFIFDDSDIEQEFGILLNKENINEYLQDRKNDYEKIQREAQEYGTIKHYEYDDPSRISDKSQ